MTQTLRDLQLQYINEQINDRQAGDFYSQTFIKMYEYLKDEVFEVAKDIAERIRDGVDEGFVESWRDRVMDYLISKIDWDELNQCETCHKYFNWLESDSDDQSFCSGECEEAYEEQKGGIDERAIR